MRFFHICQDAGIPVFGRKGASTHIREMCRALHQVGHEVHLVCADLGPDVDRSLGFGMTEIAPARSKKLGQDFRAMVTNWRFKRRLPALAREFRPDVIYQRHSLYTGAATHLARRLGIPHLIEVNAILSRELAHRLHHPGWALKRERAALCSADRVIAVSGHLKRECMELGVAEERIEISPISVDPDHFQPHPRSEERRREWGFAPDDVVVGYLGALTKWHRADLLIDAFSKCESENMRLLFIGGADHHIADLKKQADALGIGSRLHFTGSVPYAEVPTLLSEVDIGTLPGLHEWATPTKIFEYWAMGIALVAPRAESVAAVAEEGRTALVFEPGDAQSLANALNRLARDGSLRQRMGEAGREAALANHTWRRSAEQVTAMCREIGKS